MTQHADGDTPAASPRRPLACATARQRRRDAVSAATAHLACVALVAVDFVARTWRTQLFLRALGHPLTFGAVFVQSGIGETASSLTPLRAGGEPARVWVMTRQGVPRRAGVVCVGVELVATSAVIALIAVVLAVTVAPEWWRRRVRVWCAPRRAGGPGWRSSARPRSPCGLAVRRLRPDLLHAARDELAATRGHLRDIPSWMYLAQVPLTVLNVGARVAVLPVLASTLEQPPTARRHGDGVVRPPVRAGVRPHPAGAGAVDAGFLGGAAGNLGDAEAALLLAGGRTPQDWERCSACSSRSGAFTAASCATSRADRRPSRRAPAARRLPLPRTRPHAALAHAARRRAPTGERGWRHAGAARPRRLASPDAPLTPGTSHRSPTASAGARYEAYRACRRPTRRSAPCTRSWSEWRALPPPSCASSVARCAVGSSRRAWSAWRHTIGCTTVASAC
jgi:hypothetical protein